MSDRATDLEFEVFASTQDGSGAADFTGALPSAAEGSSFSKLDWLTTPYADAQASSAPAPAASFTHPLAADSAPASDAPTPVSAPVNAPPLSSPPPPPPMATAGVIQNQTVDDLINFSVSKAESNPGLPNFSFPVPSSLSFSTGSQKSFSVVGIPVSMSFSLFGGIKGGLSGSFGTYSFNYPVTIGVTMARDVADGAIFTVDPTLIGVDDASFSMNGPFATASLSLGFGAKANLSVGSGGSLLSVSPSFSKTTGLKTSFTYDIDAVPGLSLTVEDPKTFSDDDTTSAAGALPSMTVSGSGNNFLSASLDIVKLAISLLDDVLPGIDALDTTINFDVGSLSYAIASLPLTAGLKLGQSLTLTPGTIQETLTEYLNGVQTSNTAMGGLGATSLQVTAPSSGAGEIDIHATYTETFTITTSTGIEGDISLALNGPHASGNIFGIPFTIGPLGHVPIFDFSSGFIGGPIGGSPVTNDTFSDSTVYKVFYGYGAVVPTNGTTVIDQSFPSFPGGFLVDDDGSLFFNVGAYTLTNDILFNGNGTIFHDDDSGSLSLQGNLENNSTTGMISFAGVGAVGISGQYDVSTLTEILSGITVNFSSGQTIPGTFDVASGATLLFQQSSSIGGLEGDGSIKGFFGSNGTLTVGADGDSTTFAGNFIQRPEKFNLVKVGNDTLTFATTQLYNGATTAKAGDLVFEDDDTTLLGDVTVLNPGALLVLGNSISLGGLWGDGEVVLDNSAGVALTVGDDNNNTRYAGDIKNFAGTSTLTKVGTGGLTLFGVDQINGATRVNGGQLGIIDASTHGVTAFLESPSIVLAAGTALGYNVADQNDREYTVSATISGAGQLVVVGPNTGIIGFSGANSFTGGAEIDSGIVEVGNANALGSGPVAFYGGAIRAVNANQTLGETINVKGTVGLGSGTNFSGAVNLLANATVTASITAGNDQWIGPVNLGAFTLATSDVGPATNGATWSGQTLTISGVISGSGGVTQGSSGAITIEGDDTYTGATTIDSGSLSVVNVSTNSVSAKLGSAGVAIGASGALVFVNFDTVNDGYYVNNQISGAGSLVFAGSASSVTTMNDDNVVGGFTGLTQIISGIVNVQNWNAFGTGTVEMLGGAIRATQFPAYISNNFEMLGTVGLGAATNLLGAIELLANTTVTASENAGDSTWSGPINLQGFTLATGDTGPSTDGATWSGDDLTLSGPISGSGGVTQGSSGGLVLSGANSYTGTTSVNDGFLTVESSNALGAGALSILDSTINFDASYTFSKTASINYDAVFNIAGGDVVTLTGAIDPTTVSTDFMHVAGGGRLIVAGDFEMHRVVVESGATLEVATNVGDNVIYYVQSGATLIFDSGDAGKITDIVASSGATVEFMGVLADSATITGGNTLNLLKNGATVYSVAESGYGAAPFVVPIYKGSKVAGSEVVTSLPNPVSILGFQDNQNAYAGASPAYAIADTAANIAANLAWLTQNEGVYSTLTSTDVPVSVTVSTYTSNRALLDRITDNFVVADTAPNILGALAALNGDAHASLAITSGTGTLSSGQIAAPLFAVSGSSTSLTLGENLAYAGTFSEGAGATVSVGSGDTLSLKGPAALSGNVGGAGALALYGTANVASAAQLTTARLSLTNKSNVTTSGALTYAGTFVAAAGSTLNIAHGSLTLKGTSNVSGALGGAGLLGLAAGTTNFLSGATLAAGSFSISGTATANVGEALHYGGSFSEVSGVTLNVLGGDAFTLLGSAKISGAIRGLGTLTFSSATATLSGAAVLSVANWQVLGGLTTLSKSLAYAGALNVELGAEITLSGSTASLALQGKATFDGATIDGAGAVTSAGPNSVTTVGGLTIGGAVNWTNSKSVVESGGDLQIGDASGSTAKFTNAKSGTYNITDDSGVDVGASLSSIFANAGLLEKTGGSGDSLIQTNITNSGRVVAASGEIELGGAISGTGSLQVADGGLMQIDGVVASTQTLVYGGGGGTFALDDLDLVGAQLFHGVVHGWGANDALIVGTEFGSGASYAFTENAGHTGGVLAVGYNGASASISFNGLSGVVTTANFTESFIAGEGTMFAYHS